MELIVLSNYNCVGCESLKRKLKSEDAPFKEINVTDTPEAIDTYSIMSTPVLLLMDEGEEVSRIVGYTYDKADEVELFIDQL